MLLSPKRGVVEYNQEIDGQEDPPDYKENHLSSANDFNLHSNPAHSNMLIEDEEEYQ